MSRPTGLAIDQGKLLGYLLNVDHPEGGPKARFFLARGFDAANPEEFADALALHAIQLWPEYARTSRWGVKQVLEGELLTPTGRVRIRSVWQIRADTQAWLVTAYPI